MNPDTNNVLFEDSEKGIKKMAVYIAELVRQGIVYTVDLDRGYYTVRTTGGF